MLLKRVGKSRYSSIVLDLGTRWRGGVSFTSNPLYSRRNRPQYPLDNNLGEPQSRSELDEEEKHLASAGNRTPTTRTEPSLYVAI
jgi:hypothetical protein